MLTKKYKPYNRFYYTNKNRLRPRYFNEVAHRDVQRGRLTATPLAIYSYAKNYISKRFKTDKKTFCEVLNFMFDGIIDRLLEERDGVFLKGIGYFFFFMAPTPGIKYNGRHSLNVYGRKYFPVFRADGRNNPLMDFYLPYRIFTREHELRERIANNQLYTHSLSMFQDREVAESYESQIDKGRINRKKHEFYRASRNNQKEFQIARFLRAVRRPVDI